MKCKLCDSDMKRVGSKAWCSECKRFYDIDGEAQKLCKDNEGALKVFQEAYQKTGAVIKGIAETLGIKKEEGKKEKKDEKEENDFIL